MSSKETQRRIKNTALALFNEHGTNRISTNTIAEQCGISKGNLHYHYRNKQQLIRAIYADMIAEIESGWYGDEEQPTVTHMAEMFVRQVELIWRYRFFYREMVPLIQGDPDLAVTVREDRKKRMDAVVRFFAVLVDAGVLNKPRSNESLRYLVVMTWIFSDNWLNFVQLQGGEDWEDEAALGYDLILEMLYPYLTEKAKKEIYQSYEALNRSVSAIRSAR